MTTLNTHFEWIKQFYAKRSWIGSSTQRLIYLTEEVGELAQAIRTHEIGRDHPGEQKKSLRAQRDNITEEMADILDQIFILCDILDITPEELCQYSEHKLTRRFNM